MFSTLSTNMLLAMLAISAVAAFYVGNAMNSLLGALGFGALGNSLVLFFGFLLGQNVLRYLSYRVIPEQLMLPGAIGLAFATLFLLVTVKRLVQRA